MWPKAVISKTWPRTPFLWIWPRKCTVAAATITITQLQPLYTWQSHFKFPSGQLIVVGVITQHISHNVAILHCSMSMSQYTVLSVFHHITDYLFFHLAVHWMLYYCCIVPILSVTFLIVSWLLFSPQHSLNQLNRHYPIWLNSLIT